MRRRHLLQLLSAPLCFPVTLPTAQKLITAPPNIPAMVQQARQAWLSGNSGPFAQLFAEEGVMIVPGNRWQGPQAIAAAFEAYAAEYSVTAITVRSLVVQPAREGEAVSRAVVEWVWEDINRATQATSRAEDAIAIDVRGGRIVRWREYIDSLSP